MAAGTRNGWPTEITRRNTVVRTGTFRFTTAFKERHLGQ